MPEVVLTDCDPFDLAELGDYRVSERLVDEVMVLPGDSDDEFDDTVGLEGRSAVEISATTDRNPATQQRHAHLLGRLDGVGNPTSGEGDSRGLARQQIIDRRRHIAVQDGAVELHHVGSVDVHDQRPTLVEVLTEPKLLEGRHDRIMVERVLVTVHEVDGHARVLGETRVDAELLDQDSVDLLAILDLLATPGLLLLELVSPGNQFLETHVVNACRHSDRLLGES